MRGVELGGQRREPVDVGGQAAAQPVQLLGGLLQAATGAVCGRLAGYAGLDLHQLRHSAATTSARPRYRCSSSWARPGTRTPAPPCATSNPVPKPSPRSPRSWHPRRRTH
ncbi:hypothetical protein ACFQ0B_57095 [Nonomuraea thailandensis]